MRATHFAGGRGGRQPGPARGRRAAAGQAPPGGTPPDRLGDRTGALLEALPLAVAWLDADLTLAGVNRACAEAWAQETGSLVGRNCLEVLPQREFRDLVRRVRATAKPQTQRAVALGQAAPRGSGRRYWDLTLAPLAGPAGLEGGLLLAMAEVTATVRGQRRRVLEAIRNRILERRRVARELHDAPQQTLALAVLRLRLAGQAATPAEATEGQRQVGDLLTQAAGELRALCEGLAGPDLEEAGIEDAVQWLAEEARQRTGASIDVHIRGPWQALPEGTQTVLFEAAQGLLGEAVGCGRPSRAVLRLAVGRSWVPLEVEGPGAGGPTPVTGVEELAGTAPALDWLEDAVKAFGGRLQARVRADRGWVVRVALPRAED